MKIYVDLDDVIADTVSSFLVIGRERFGQNVQYQEVDSFDLSTTLRLEPAAYEQFMKIAHEPATLLRIEPIAGAKEVIARCQERGDEIVVATGRPSYCAEASSQWLFDHGFIGTKLLFVDKYAHSRDDSLSTVVPLELIPEMEFDIAIEDSPDVAKYLAGLMPRRVVLVSRPWNRYVFTSNPQLPLLAADTWEEISARIEELRR